MESRRIGEAERLAAWIARADSWSDYDLWRAVKTIDDEIYRLERCGSPLPIRLLYLRRILDGARVVRSAEV